MDILFFGNSYTFAIGGYDCYFICGFLFFGYLFHNRNFFGKMKKFKKPVKPIKPRLPAKPEEPKEFMSPFPILVDIDELIDKQEEEKKESTFKLEGLEDRLFEILKKHLVIKTEYIDLYGPNFIDKLSKSEISFGKISGSYCDYSYYLIISGENLLNHIELQRFRFYEEDFKIYQRKIKKFEESEKRYRSNLIKYEKDIQIYEKSLKEYKEKLKKIKEFAESL